jgi:hypothetical protein
VRAQSQPLAIDCNLPPLPTKDLNCTQALSVADIQQAVSSFASFKDTLSTLARTVRQRLRSP